MSLYESVRCDPLYGLDPFGESWWNEVPGVIRDIIRNPREVIRDARDGWNNLPKPVRDAIDLISPVDIPATIDAVDNGLAGCGRAALACAVKAASGLTPIGKIKKGRKIARGLCKFDVAQGVMAGKGGCGKGKGRPSQTPRGTPNTVERTYDKQGRPAKDRYFDDDGNAIKDIDYGHPNHHPWSPHEHRWPPNNGPRGPAAPPNWLDPIIIFPPWM